MPNAEHATAYLALAGVLVDGQWQTSVVRDVLNAFAEETVDGLARCEITINLFGQLSGNQQGYLYFGRDVLDFGKEVNLQLGPSPLTSVFVGRIRALEAEYPAGGMARLRILAEDKLQDLRMTRRTRSFEDLSDSDVITQIANEHGLTPDVSLTGPTHKSITQVNQSDLAFVRERARACGAEVWVSEGKLTVKNRSARSNPPIEMFYGASLHSFSVRADLAHQCTEMKVSGWDVAAKEAIVESGQESHISNELNGGVSGSSILQQKFGSRVASLVHNVPLTGSEAFEIAKARYRERARRFVTGTALVDGDTRIRVGTTITFKRLGTLFDGAYYVVRARHNYSRDSGYTTELDVERPYIGQ